MTFEERTGGCNNQGFQAEGTGRIDTNVPEETSAGRVRETAIGGEIRSSGMSIVHLGPCRSP